MIEDGSYRFLSASSRAEVVADAPGHKFRATGDGLTGTAKIENGVVVAAEASFPLANLDAGDMLSNREMKKFLELGRRPTVSGRVSGPIPLSEDAGGFAGSGTIAVELQGRATQPIPIRVSGSGSRVTIQLEASFSRFGHKAPKLLFIKVKDEFALKLDCRIERE